MNDDTPTVQEMAQLASTKAKADEELKARIEILAEKLYETMEDSETYKAMTGKAKPAWRIEGLAYDNHPDLEIAEHRRDDFRQQAKLLLNDPDLKKEQAKLWMQGCFVGWEYGLDIGNKLPNSEASIDGALKQNPHDPDCWEKDSPE